MADAENFKQSIAERAAKAADDIRGIAGDIRKHADLLREEARAEIEGGLTRGERAVSDATYAKWETSRGDLVIAGDLDVALTALEALQPRSPAVVDGSVLENLMTEVRNG